MFLEILGLEIIIGLTGLVCGLFSIIIAVWIFLKQYKAIQTPAITILRGEVAPDSSYFQFISHLGETGTYNDLGVYISGADPEEFGFEIYRELLIDGVNIADIDVFNKVFGDPKKYDLSKIGGVFILESVTIHELYQIQSGAIQFHIYDPKNKIYQFSIKIGYKTANPIYGRIYNSSKSNLIYKLSMHSTAHKM